MTAERRSFGSFQYPASAHGRDSKAVLSKPPDFFEGPISTKKDSIRISIMSQPTADTIDDILYCARYGELDELKDANFPAEYFKAADESGNTALHMACANGHLGKRHIH
jgi:hypothetical protein